MAEPGDRSELKEGVRLLREVLKAIPPDLDDREDAVLRKVVEGMARAAALAAKEAPSSEEPSPE
jgi:hypothetical protein